MSEWKDYLIVIAIFFIIMVILLFVFANLLPNINPSYLLYSSLGIALLFAYYYNYFKKKSKKK